MKYFHGGRRATAPAWKLARALLGMLGKALERSPPVAWIGAPPGLAAQLCDLGKPLSAVDENEAEARAAERLARSVRVLREGWRTPEGHFSTVDAAFAEAMAARALEAIETCAAAGASGNELMSLHAFSSAAFSVGAAVAFADPDAAIVAAKRGQARAAAMVLHTKGPKAQGKAAAKVSYGEWQSGSTTYASGAAFARAMVDAGHSVSTTVVERWVSAWNKARRPAAPRR